jgi:hypothetical protein
MFIIVSPVFNDWTSAARLLAELDAALASEPGPWRVLLVNDGSSEPIPAGFPGRAFNTLESVDVLHLRRNVGHQRAIAIGLVHVHLNENCDAVVVMDADGEDRPSDVPKLMERFRRHEGKRIVFAARAKRLESWVFQCFYHTYRLVHRIFTGDPVRVGNFSVLPRAALSQLAVVPEIWNHYAASVIRWRLAWDSIPIARGPRYAGRSKMRPIGLVLHGLSAIFVYGEIVGARLFAASLGMIALAAAGLAAALVLRFTTQLAWTAAVLLIVLLQAALISLVAVFTVIGSRVNVTFLPIRDCPYFVAGRESLFLRKS